MHHNLQDDALRALARCSKSTIIIGAVSITSKVGGPLGAAIGAGFATSIGILARQQIRDSIQEPRILVEIEETTVDHCLFETITNVIAVGTTCLVGDHLQSVLEDVTPEALSKIDGLLQQGD